MLLLVLTSNEQETRVLLVLVFLMMTKPARQVGVQPPPSPTGERSAGRSPAAEPTSVTTNQTNVTNDATHDNLSVTEPIKTPDVPLTENQRAAQAELDFLDDDSEITFDDNNSETLNSLDVSDIGPNIVIPGGGVGLTPTGQVFSNSSENVLNNPKNVVSSNGRYVIEFIDKYIDDNNNKIC